MHVAVGLFALALWAASAHGAEAQLTQQQADARRQQAELRTRIEALQQEIERHEASRRDAATELKASESAISAHNRRLAELATQQDEAKQALASLDKQIADQKALLGVRQQELGDQLRAQYASGLSPWTALLSGDDPQEIGRELSYLGYVTRAQAEAVTAVRQAIVKLDALQARAAAHRATLSELAKEAVAQKQALEEQKAERQEVLDRIESVLKEQRGQAERLALNDKRLANLISDLEKEIARQLEEARIAEEKRRAEAARKEEEARQAALARRRAIEEERARAREAEAEARAAQEAAKRMQDQAEAERARLQVERARAEARAAEEAAIEEARAAEARRPKVVQGSVEGLGPSEPRVAPPGGFTGLRKGAPSPVQGDVLGRFGAERPDGGLWRGIVLRAAEGTAVQAIAAGRVVYASWLAGFGNIMIIDHGQKYLSVYAYNQSLLKRVGDIVHAGDKIATVGATGGQVDPGLYFEIRHEGTPVNPLLWLRR